MKKCILVVICLLLVVPLAYAQCDDADSDGVCDDVDACNNPEAPCGMISYWGLEETAGTTAADSFDAHPGANHGALIGQPGQVGTAYSFDGMDDYVHTAASLDGYDDVSIALWLKADSVSKDRSVVSNYEGGQRGLAIVCDPDYIMFAGRPYGGTTPLDFYAALYLATIQTDRWYHVVGVKQDDQLQIYVDGAFGGQDGLDDDFAVQGYSSMHIGAGIEHGGSPDWHFHGSVDEVAIFNRALTATEIQRMYQNGLNDHEGYCDEAPTVEVISVPWQHPIDIDDQATYAVNVTFSDPAGAQDEPYTCDFDMDHGGVTFDADVTVGGVVGTSCSTPLNYSEPGVYLVKVRVTDKDGAWGTATATEYIVIYDPDSGFVTGGGWILSPQGAYVPDPGLTGKATFGFVSKYKRGAAVPTGRTQFHFKVADLNFHSGTYDWLVVAGARAMYRGTGAINGEGDYKFTLTAIDADINRSDAFDVDRFRIKIWEEDEAGVEVVVYDNGLSADQNNTSATTELGGGSIVIHKAG